MTTLIAAAPPAELLRPITNGTIVRLPDDTLAEVVWSDFETVEVLHAYLRIANIPGAGPWSYARHQVEEASEAEQAAYRTAVVRATANAAKVLTWIPVIGTVRS